jgi:hypothetical protein
MIKLFFPFPHLISLKIFKTKILECNAFRFDKPHFQVIRLDHGSVGSFVTFVDGKLYKDLPVSLILILESRPP